VCGPRGSTGLGNGVGEAANLKSFHCATQRRRAESKLDDECETDSVQNLFHGDFSGGARLDKYGLQHAQGGRKSGKCSMKLYIFKFSQYLMYKSSNLKKHPAVHCFFWPISFFFIIS